MGSRPREELGWGSGLCVLVPEGASRGCFLPRPRPVISPTSFWAKWSLPAQTEKEKPSFHQGSLHPPHPTPIPGGPAAPGSSPFSFTRFAFFSSALLADMMEEARVFFSQPPHDGPCDQATVLCRSQARGGQVTTSVWSS